MSTDAKKNTSGLGARRASLNILSSVLRNNQTLDNAITNAFLKANLDERDAGFARAIASETLRRFGTLESLIGKFVRKPPMPHKAGPTLEILLAGACELLFLKTAPHAAVDAANRLAQEDSKAVHFKPLINAVLRRLTREGEAVLESLDSVNAAMPDWMWERVSSHYGEEIARAIAEVHLKRPPLDLVFKTDDDPLMLLLEGERLAPGCVRLAEAGKIEALPGFSEGRWWVQDFAASLPAQMLGKVNGEQVIDLCAAPGGKTAQLASKGANVKAVDISKERMDIVRRNFARLNLSAEMIVVDARDWRPEVAAPFVFLDAPCTATGTIRRHPELPWIKTAADINAQESLQRELFDSAADMTACGGTLVYAVCSLEPEEGIEQVEAFLARSPNFVREPLRPDEVPDAAFISAAGDLRTLPHHWAAKGGMDGFYAARLRCCV